MSAEKAMTFMQACRDFFGLKAGQTNIQFAQEYKALPPEDRAEIRKGLEEKGYVIINVGEHPPVKIVA